MKIEITPTEKPGALEKNLRARVKEIHRDGTKITVETEDSDFLEKVPGIKEYSVEKETRKGMGGSPVDEKAYIKMDTREDVAKAFLATASGYDLVVINSSREWDLKLLRKYNPSIKEVSEPSDVFGIKKSVNVEGYEKIGIEVDDEEVDIVYRQVFR